MKSIDYAKVDMGAVHNGGVRWRKIFRDANRNRFIVDKGKRKYVILISRSIAGVNYVIHDQPGVA